ncbi:MAG: hypothetical protein AYP45_00500 [Candidatus Brocadia carolinensis]|uniref:Uncharacterized protein n=1 Tax=Candidatus Brocadia carolinensis TaxID=1004156 RepID=A0A1V4AXU7_9BACT|nr:MAG: hypothetical protein AYP45_00500 [Candidatus Brocadia caroliniensis]
MSFIYQLSYTKSGIIFKNLIWTRVIKYRLFGKTVNLEDLNVLQNLSEVEAKNTQNLLIEII